MDLRDTAGGNQRAYRNKAPITRRKVGPKPEIAEQSVRGVLHDGRKRCAELLPDASGAVRLSAFVKRQQ